MTCAFLEYILNFRSKFSDIWGLGYSVSRDQVPGIGHPCIVDGLCGKRVVDIAMGGTHCLALTEDGEVYSWGKNEKGQLGDGFYNSKYELGLVAALEGKNIVGICCGVNQVRDNCNLFLFLVIK